MHGDIDLELFATLNGPDEGKGAGAALLGVALFWSIPTYRGRITVTSGERRIHNSIIATLNTRIQKYSWPTDSPS